MLGGNCPYLYSIMDSFTPNVVCMDLVHAFVHEDEEGVEIFSLPFVNRLNKRITINKKTIKYFTFIFFYLK